MLNNYENEIFDKAMEYANAAKYELAINYLLPLATHDDEESINNLGVCYLRLKKYEQAYKWFKKTTDTIAIQNILTLYDNDYIKFNLEEYISLCNILIEKESPEGYLYLSYIYQNNKRGIECKRLAYLAICDGLTKFKNNKSLLFEFAYLTEHGIGCDIDYEVSYKCYKALAIDNSVSESKLTVARYNLGLQLIQGKGCEVNYEEGINFLTLAAIKNYKDACTYLTRILTVIEDIKDLELASMWEAIGEGKQLTNKQNRIYNAVFRRALKFKLKNTFFGSKF